MLGVHKKKKELSVEVSVFAVQLQVEWAEREWFCILSISESHSEIPGVFGLVPSLTVARYHSRVLLPTLKWPLVDGFTPIPCIKPINKCKTSWPPFFSQNQEHLT